MYKKYCIALAGLYIMLLTACTSVHSLSSVSTPRITAITNNQFASPGKKNSLVGPPEYIPDTVVKKSTPPKIIERGGRYVYLAPAYTRSRPEIGTEKYEAETLQQKINRIKKFAAENNYDTAVAFFIDMRVKSGKERFFVVNLASNTIFKKALAAHGKGNKKFTFDRKFSNDEGSNCTSLGIYKIGKAYTGAFGLSYKLYGLNKTNNNALKRYVVLHAMGSIPDEESKWPITQTEGCPAVSPAFLHELAPLLDNAEKSVLLYIYYGDSK
ncbi:MAG: murein L,D-transpeptidase catalytic domain-containing protein [Chitinophagaceae bacterium]